MKTSALVLVLMLLATACDKSSTPSGSSATASSEPSASAKAQVSKEKTAFLLGRKMAFAGAFELSGAKDKSAQAMTEAAALAKALGIDAPKASNLDEKDKAYKALEEKHGGKAAAHLGLGYYLTDSWFGAELGAKVAMPLARAEANAQLSGIPESLWKEKLTAIKADPKSDAIAALAKDVEASLK
jgi:hypothetical protein